MQIFALAVMLARHDLSASVLIELGLSIPALMAGSMLGILAFRSIHELMFPPHHPDHSLFFWRSPCCVTLVARAGRSDINLFCYRERTERSS
jgi:hypothetical protein